MASRNSFTGTPLWPFGYGSSYSNFTLEWTNEADGESGEVLQTTVAQLVPTSISTSAGDGGGDATPLVMSVTVSNHGPLPGAKAVMAFVANKNDSSAPLRTLVGVRKVYLEVGASKTVSFTADDAVSASTSTSTSKSKSKS